MKRKREQGIDEIYSREGRGNVQDRPENTSKDGMMLEDDRQETDEEEKRA